MAPGRVFYGWWVALAFSVIMFISTGIRFTVGPFLKPVVADLGLDRGSFSLVISLSLLLYGAFMPLVGCLVDRFGSRPVVTAGAVVLAGALGATGAATSLWQLYLFYGILVAAGLAATGYVVASAILVRWFVKRRGAALGLLSGATMAGMTFLVPVAMGLILALGWRATYALLGLCILLLVLPLSLGVLRDDPSAVGDYPDGVAPDAGDASIYFMRALAFALLFVVHEPVMLMLAAAFSGLGMSGSLAMTSALTGDIFGRFSVGSIFGAIFLIHQGGASLGSWLGGFLFDVTGGYGAAFALACGLLLLGALLSTTIDAEPRRVPALAPVAGGR